MNTQRQRVDKRAAKTWLLLPPAARALFPQPPLCARDPDANHKGYVLLALGLGVDPPPRPATSPTKRDAQKSGARPKLGPVGWASVRRLKARGLSEVDAVARVAARQRKAANAH